MIDNNRISPRLKSVLASCLVLAGCLSLGWLGSATTAKPKIETDSGAGPGEGCGPQQGPPLERVGATRGSKVFICGKEKIIIS